MAYLINDEDCKQKGMTAEEILTVIQQALEGITPLNPDAGIITKVKETNAGGYITFWVGTQAQYNAMNGNIVENCLYIISDETTAKDMDKEIKAISEKLGTVENALSNMTVFKTAGMLVPQWGLETGVTLANGGFCEYTYDKALGMAYLKATLFISGVALPGTVLMFDIPDGAFKRESVPRIDPVTVCGGKRLGSVDACFVPTGLQLTANDGFAINESESDSEMITLTCWYPCGGKTV